MRRQTFDARLRPFGITAVQYWVLGRLARTNDSGLTQTELARALESGKVSVGALVTRLEALGLVERRDDSRDRRIRRLFLTDTGYVAIEQIAAVAHPIDCAALDGGDDDTPACRPDTLPPTQAPFRRINYE